MEILPTEKCREILKKEILDISASRFHPKPSFSQNDREDYLDSNDTDFEDLDNRIYELDKKINLIDKIVEYIKENRMAFYFQGQIEVDESTHHSI